MRENVRFIPAASAKLVKELEALAIPLLAAIATAKRLPEISVPSADDGHIAFELNKIAAGFRKELRVPIASTDKFARALTVLEKSMQNTVDRVPWHQKRGAI
jgi:Tfp pilus assembly protein FimV